MISFAGMIGCRDDKYDALKGIAIVMMVAFHAGAPQWASRFGYLFHMPIFFILAGWFFSLNYSEDIKSCFLFIRKRLRRIWWPMFFWGFLFTVLHNELIKLHLIGHIDGGLASQYWTPVDFLRNMALSPIAIDGYSELAGAFWFLRALFLAASLYCVVTLTLRAFCQRPVLWQTLLALFVLYWGHNFRVPMVRITGGAHTLTAYALIHLGFLLRHYDMRLERLPPFAMVLCAGLCFVILCVLSVAGRISIAENEFPNVAFLLVSALLGWYLLVAVSFALKGRSRSFFCFIGRHTMPIVIFHFLAFKVVSLAGIFLRGDPISHLTGFPVLYRDDAWWIAYTIAGVTLPLGLNLVYGHGIKKLAILKDRSVE